MFYLATKLYWMIEFTSPNLWYLINSNRDSLQIPRGEHETESPRLVGLADGLSLTAESEYAECNSAGDRNAGCCRSLALTVC